MTLEFTRTQWLDYNARDIWEPRFNKISSVQNKMEVQSVLRRRRHVGMPSLTRNQFNRLELPKGFVAKIHDVASAPDVFNTLSMPFEEGKPFTIRTVIGAEDTVKQYLTAYDEGNQKLIGALLGYPRCCTDFFIKTWVERKIRDFTWEMMHSPNNFPTAVIDPLPLINPFYTKHGVRPVWHMPCSVRCQESNDLAKWYLEDWPEEETEWLKEIFTWPVEWSSLHGAAEIRTPVCKIITDTDPTNIEHVIQFPGRGFPVGRGVGNRFPYGPSENYWANNGFYTLEGMNAAHDLIIEVSKLAKDVKSISDPGCGNGHLLNRLSRMFGVKAVHGIDRNHHAIVQGRNLYGLNLIEGSLFDFYSSGDLVVFMPGRLLENRDRAERFVQELNFRYLLLYGYSAYASKVMELKKQYWPDCKIISTMANNGAIATLLERP
jgi:hypothetical protein